MRPLMCSRLLKSNGLSRQSVISARSRITRPSMLPSSASARIPGRDTLLAFRSRSISRALSEPDSRTSPVSCVPPISKDESASVRPLSPAVRPSLPFNPPSMAWAGRGSPARRKALAVLAAAISISPSNFGSAFAGREPRPCRKSRSPSWIN